MRATTKLLRLCAVALAILLPLGCGGGSSSTSDLVGGERVYVGSISGTDALIALVERDGAVLAYSCGGRSTWRTHTGWYATRLGANDELQKARNAAGLQLTGSLATDTASGSLTLPDGTALDWTAELANPDRGAGLRARTAAGELTGLIVTNDGRTAGTSRTTTSDLSTASAPVSIATPPTTGTTPPTTTTTPPPTTTTTTTTTVVPPSVTVTVPGLPVSGVPLTPVLDPRRISVTKTSPVIIVLLHGATTELPRPTAAEVSSNGVPGTRKHARRYWTYPFVAGLLGGATNQPLTTLAGQNVTGSAFLNDALADPGVGVDTIPDPSSCNFNDLITAETFPATQAARIPGQPEAPPKLSLLLGHRDGKRSLIQQSMDAANQVSACVTRFEERFQQKPALIFVAHSYGGLVTRLIFSSPTRASLAAMVNPDSGDRLQFPSSATENASYDVGASPVRVKMSALRDTTLYAVTISTPHEGTRVMDKAAEVRTLLRHVRDGGATLTQAEQLTRDRLRASLSLLLDLPASGVLSAAPVVAALDDLDQQFAANRVMTEARPGLWRALNTGALQPASARRTPTSPIVGAGGQLIPIYTTGGRNPGGQVFDTPDLGAIRSAYDATNQLQMAARVQSQLIMTIGGDYAYAFFDAAAGGPKAPPAGFTARLDRTERVDWVTFTTLLADSAVPNLNRFFRAEFGADTSSILRFLERGFGVRGTANLPIYLNQTFAIDMGGTARVPVPRLSCGGTSFTLDYGPLLTGLSASFGSLSRASTSLQAANAAAFLASLTALGGNLSTIVAGMTTFVTTTITGLAGLSDACKDILRLDRWALTWPLTNVPAPRIVATGNAVADGAVDNDGLVEYDSAMGLRLGTGTNEFFDHTGGGSWYRRYRSDVEQFSHEAMRRESGTWIWETIISRGAGPLPSGAGNLSVFP